MYPFASGIHQAPINIQTDRALFDKKLSTVPLSFTYDQHCFESIENTGFGFNVFGSPYAFSSIKLIFFKFFCL
jgi:hypothetical protein